MIIINDYEEEIKYEEECAKISEDNEKKNKSNDEIVP